ncbi:MAG: 50S ribosomal protein L25 [bacterium]|nr:50S ribosomal protein L25 [bacterium]MDD5353889.1 50S ribosomal protein L25 [bacterium]MDD5756995.1 50S ribosomal protein L25 [bacterium]
MKEVILEVKERAEKGTRVSKRLRVAGTIPAVLYGAKQTPISLGIAVKEFNRIIHGGAGENVVLTLKFGGDKKEAKTAIIKEIQRDPVSRNILHIDLLAISLKDKIKVNVPVMVTGEAPGIKEGGILEYVQREVEVECLPTQIPEHIMVDVSSLKINESIHVRDLKLSDDQVKVLTPAERMLVSIVPPTILEEPVAAEGAIAPEAAAAATAEPEVIKKGKKEEEPAEGAAAAPAKEEKK